MQHLQPVWLAFQRLNVQRANGINGGEKLSVSDILFYHEKIVYYFDVEDFLDFIISLDGVLLAHIAAKSAPTQPATKK